MKKSELFNNTELFGCSVLAQGVPMMLVFISMMSFTDVLVNDMVTRYRILTVSVL